MSRWRQAGTHRLKKNWKRRGKQNRYTVGVEGEMTGRRNTKQCVEELAGDSWSGLKAAACVQCTVQ